MAEEEFRLQKFLAYSGVASRRASEVIIAAGRVTVNGETVTDPAVKVTTKDRVEVDGTRVKPVTSNVYIMMNKPVGVLSSAKDDRGRKCVTDLVDLPGVRIYPVGRLDYDTSGLILLTNDGEFMQKLMHPSFEVWKTYEAIVKGQPTQADLDRFETGIELEDGMTLPAHADVVGYRGSKPIVEVRIREGRNRQVRRMLEAIGHGAISLERVGLGGLDLGDLKEGAWRYLKKRDFEDLFGRNEAHRLGYT